MLSPDSSPDKLTQYGGRRLNRLPLLFTFLLFGLLVGLIGYTYLMRLEKNKAESSKEANPPSLIEPASPPKFNQVPADFGVITPKGIPSTKRVASPNLMPSSPSPISPTPTPSDSMAWQTYSENQRKVAEARMEAAMAAMDAPTTVALSQEEGGIHSNNPNPVGTYGIPKTTDEGGSTLGEPSADTSSDPNKQAAKAKWLNQTQANEDDYLTTTRKAPLSPFELKAGTVIPAVMIGGINSDLPGTIIGQVSQNVYDSATGQYLLIPQGSRLIGRYDNGVSMGQKRILIGWNRVIYPDGSSLDLGLMPGTDRGGYGGFTDKVDNHYTQVFGNALLLSLFSAGIQLSQPQSNNDDNYNSGQIIAASIGQQMGQLGMAMAQRGLNIAPTLEIRPGYPFNIVVTKDIILKPWEGH